jgi:DNA-binding CsgD family transcriptional regulator
VVATSVGARDGIIRVCARSSDTQSLLRAVASRVRRGVAFDAALWTGTDPATQLFTVGVAEGVPAEACGAFLDNEFLAEDVGKFHTLTAEPPHVGVLSLLTGGEPARSHRYRTLLEPFGWSDELRVAFSDGTACWGVACLLRAAGRPPFSERDVDWMTPIVAHVAAGLRMAARPDGPGAPDETGPGTVILDGSGTIVALTAAAERWLTELGHPAPHLGARDMLPNPVLGVAHRANLCAGGAADVGPARVRVPTLAGRWLVLHAAVLDDGTAGARHTAVVVEPAEPAEIAPLIMRAYQLTERERTVTALVCQGLSTNRIAERLAISPHTVRDHVKAVFAKTAARSRGELMARLFTDHYAARHAASLNAADH